jgi:microcystin-dependent protein
MGDGTLKACGDVRVTVLNMDDLSQATVWKDRTSTSAGNRLDAPFLTPSTGLVQIYADPGVYRIDFHDTQAPARISDFSVTWDAVPGDINPADLGFQLGDLKLSSLATDHGRWLRLDGRELTQAGIESSLSLSAGDGAALFNYLGTGSGSMYGAAASGKVKLPDTRRKMFMGAGPSADSTPAPMAGTTARKLGDSGGAETVLLTGNQSGIPVHSHGITDPGHGHTINDPGHAHSINDPGHLHVGLTEFAGPQLGIEHYGFPNLSGAPKGYFGLGSGNTGFVTGSSATGIGIYNNTTGIFNSANTTGVTVNATTAGQAAANAAQAHENMPPFVAVGYLFIRA